MDGAIEWTDPEWLTEAVAWIDAALVHHGRPRTGDIVQAHVRPWATALRIPTEAGAVWFKASVPALAHEAAAVQVLAQRRSDLLPAVIAVDREQGWLLLEDAGERLRELLGPDPAEVVRRWEELLPLYVQLQVSLAPFRDLLRGTGVPDRRLYLLPRLYEELVADDAALRPDHPDALAVDEVDALQELAPRVAELCRELIGQGIAETIQHDDLHDGQVFVRAGRYVFIDWGDACIAHPFFTLTVTLNSVAHRLGVDRGSPEVVRVRDAYLDAWAVRRGDTLRAFEIADLLGHVCRALSWRRVLAGTPPALMREYVDTVPGWLRAFLRAFP